MGPGLTMGDELGRYVGAMDAPDSPASVSPSVSTAVSPSASGAASASDPAPDRLRWLLGQSTQQLLGATIEVSDEQWRAPSGCPGWSRGHVASHLARNAEAVGRLAHWALTGEPQEMYASAEARDADIAAGAGRPGVELQVDLDTTAGRLDAVFGELEDQHAWDRRIETRGIAQPARILPLIRLFEVVMHHLDLDIDYGIADVDAETTAWLLEFVALRLAGRRDTPGLELRAESGFRATVGRAVDDSMSSLRSRNEAPTEVSGPDAAMLGWLTGRGPGDGLSGTTGVDLPAFS